MGWLERTVPLRAHIAFCQWCDEQTVKQDQVQAKQDAAVAAAQRHLDEVAVRGAVGIRTLEAKAMTIRKMMKARDGRGRYTRVSKTVEQDAKAAEMRSRLMSYPAIAPVLGVSFSTAWEAVRRGMALLPIEGAEEANARR
jgi:hypothetical protein